MAKKGFLDTDVIEQSPADLFNAFFQLGNAVWYIYDSYWKQKYPTSLINEANVAQVHADAIRFAVDQGAKVINLAQGIDLNLIADADKMQVLDSAILHAKTLISTSLCGTLAMVLNQK